MPMCLCKRIEGERGGENKTKAITNKKRRPGVGGGGRRAR